MQKSTNQKIVESSYKALLGQTIVENGSSGWCLRVTRQIIQDALRISHGEFYSRFLTMKASETDPNVPYARDIQISLRSLGYTVNETDVIPGDLFFSWKPMPYGHVGIVLAPEYVLENSTGSRAVARNGFLCVSRLDDVKRVMPVEFFRIP
jgi:hypothetical protein